MPVLIPTNDEMTALDARVTKLEGGSKMFSVTQQGFVDPLGNPWRMRGLNCHPPEAMATELVYRNLSWYRICCNSNDPYEPNVIDQVVARFTPNNVIIQLEDHYGGPGNVNWYKRMATDYKDNMHVFLELPNEPKDTSPQRSIVQAIRDAGFQNPVGIMAGGGWNFDNIGPTADGFNNVFATSHIYYDGNDPNEPARYVDSDIGKAAALGLYLSIDEFGEAVDGWHRNQYGAEVTAAVIAAEQAHKCGAAYWAMCNDFHPDGTCSAYLVPNGSQLTPTGLGPLTQWMG